MNTSWFLVAFLAVFAFTAIYMWVRAELDERAWRRRVEDERTAALIREHRYGSAKKGKL